MVLWLPLSEMICRGPEGVLVTFLQGPGESLQLRLPWMWGLTLLIQGLWTSSIRPSLLRCLSVPGASVSAQPP